MAGFRKRADVPTASLMYTRHHPRALAALRRQGVANGA